MPPHARNNHPDFKKGIVHAKDESGGELGALPISEADEGPIIQGEAEDDVLGFALLREYGRGRELAKMGKSNKRLDIIEETIISRAKFMDQHKVQLDRLQADAIEDGDPSLARHMEKIIDQDTIRILPSGVKCILKQWAVTRSPTINALFDQNALDELLECTTVKTRRVTLPAEWGECIGEDACDDLETVAEHFKSKDLKEAVLGIAMAIAPLFDI